MMIVDAINSAQSEHAVQFLVTAYLESLHHFHRSLGIPEKVTVLPLRGAADLERRLAALSHDNNVPREAVVGLAEARTVIGCALARLAVLTGAEAAAGAV